MKAVVAVLLVLPSLNQAVRPTRRSLAASSTVVAAFDLKFAFEDEG